MVKDNNIQVREYSEEELQQRALKKKLAIKNLSSKIKRLRSKVNEDLKSDNEKDFLTALAVLTMIESSERVGNETSAKEGHYGVTGFKKRHIKINGDSVTLKYTGKSGVEHEKVLNNSKLASNMSKAIENSSSDRVFTTSDGFNIKSDRINRYLSAFDVSAKDLRGHSANKWIVSKLKRLQPEETEQKRKRQFNKVVKEVANKVGHGAGTLKKHYMLPELHDVWLEEGRVIDLKEFKIREGGIMKQGGGVGDKLSLSGYYVSPRVFGKEIEIKIFKGKEQVGKAVFTSRFNKDWADIRSVFIDKSERGIGLYSSIIEYASKYVKKELGLKGVRSFEENKRSGLFRNIPASKAWEKMIKSENKSIHIRQDNGVYYSIPKEMKQGGTLTGSYFEGDLSFLNW